MDTTGKVVCAGLSCVDLMLLNSDKPKTVEAITSFDGTSQVAGGSCCNTSRALATLGAHVVAATLLGDDPHGKEMLKQLADSGVDVSAVKVDPKVNTSLAVLPVFTTGGRGCYVDLGANSVATPELLLGEDFSMLDKQTPCEIFHYGYPHLMKNMQGENLLRMFDEARKRKMLVSLDCNGADRAEPGVISEGLQRCFFVHVNLEEAGFIAGTPANESETSKSQIMELGNFFLEKGAGIVTISLGEHGAYLATNATSTVLSEVTEGLVEDVNQEVFLPAFAPSGEINSTGAGDTFVAGALAYTAYARRNSRKVDPKRLLAVALMSACLHIDSEGKLSNLHTIDDFIAKSPTLHSRFIS